MWFLYVFMLLLTNNISTNCSSWNINHVGIKTTAHKPVESKKANKTPYKSKNPLIIPLFSLLHSTVEESSCPHRTTGLPSTSPHGVRDTVRQQWGQSGRVVPGGSTGRWQRMELQPIRCRLSHTVHCFSWKIHSKPPMLVNQHFWWNEGWFVYMDLTL